MPGASQAAPPQILPLSLTYPLPIEHPQRVPCRRLTLSRHPVKDASPLTCWFAHVLANGPPFTIKFKSWPSPHTAPFSTSTVTPWELVRPRLSSLSPRVHPEFTSQLLSPPVRLFRLPCKWPPLCGSSPRPQAEARGAASGQALRAGLLGLVTLCLHLAVQLWAGSSTSPRLFTCKMGTVSDLPRE